MLLGSAMVEAVPVWPVMDTPTFVAKSKDLLVVKCVNPDVLGGGKDDGLTLIEVEVLEIARSKLLNLGITPPDPGPQQTRLL